MSALLHRFVVSQLLVLALVPVLPVRADEVAAVINGKAVTEAEVLAANPEALKALDNEYKQRRHDFISAQLDELVNKRILEAEAAARGVTKEAILAELKPAAVTDDDVNKFYEENRSQIPAPKAEVAERIRQYLALERKTQMEKDFYSALRAKHKVEIKLEPFRIAVDATGPSRGRADAPVTIVEFSDFQCPFCSRINPALQSVRTKYGEKVRFVFRQFPLTIHANAAKAAEASLCAEDQGKFWQMHDAMFSDQKALGIENLRKSAVKVGLNAEKFDKCLESGVKKSIVDADVASGMGYGVNGTPALFINGRLVSGAAPLEQLTTIIDDELRRAGK